MPDVWADDPSSIPDDTILWRRIDEAHIHSDPDTGAVTFSTGAYRTDQMSVHIAAKTTVETVLADYPGHRLTWFTAGDARAAGCIVMPDPVENDPSHALVGRADHVRLAMSQAKKIASAARFVE